MGETKRWDLRKTDYQERMSGAAPYISNGKVVAAHDVTRVLEAVIRPFDRVNIEGNNQKQADFLAEALSKCDVSRVHGLHMVQSAVPLAVHLDLFELGIAKKLDFAFGGPMAGRVAQLINEGKIELGAIHTYLELFARYFIDLTPRVALVCACVPLGALPRDAVKVLDGVVGQPGREIISRLEKVVVGLHLPFLGVDLGPAGCLHKRGCRRWQKRRGPARSRSKNSVCPRHPPTFRPDRQTAGKSQTAGPHRVPPAGQSGFPHLQTACATPPASWPRPRPVRTPPRRNRPASSRAPVPHQNPPGCKSPSIGPATAGGSARDKSPARAPGDR